MGTYEHAACHSACHSRLPQRVSLAPVTRPVTARATRPVTAPVTRPASREAPIEPPPAHRGRGRRASASSFPLGDLRFRLVLAGALFATGLAAWCLAPWPLAAAGLLLLLAGHLPLWARSQTTAPGGATPAHEDVWAPVEDDVARARERPREARRALGHDALGRLQRDGLPGPPRRAPVSSPPSPSSSGRPSARTPSSGWRSPRRSSSSRSGSTACARPGTRASCGRRATPSPWPARRSRSAAGKDFDLVPLLALREGRRGHYPVDARLMARPAREDASGFLGVQVQVAMNNVQGTDYPYLYAVILGKDDFRFPKAPGTTDRPRSEPRLRGRAGRGRALPGRAPARRQARRLAHRRRPDRGPRGRRPRAGARGVARERRREPRRDPPGPGSPTARSR